MSDKTLYTLIVHSENIAGLAMPDSDTKIAREILNLIGNK